jgi:succinoglycan biosynthesis transport protein ExoP
VLNSLNTHPQLRGDDVVFNDETVIDLDRLLAMVRRQWRVVALALIAGLALGFSYILTAVPQYSSSIELLIDLNNKKIVDQLSLVSGCCR